MWRRSIVGLTLVLVATPASSLEWYQGGTLHNATIREWRDATARNRLATAADWVTSVVGFKSLEDTKAKATDVVECVNGSTNDPSIQSENVAPIGLICMYGLGYEMKK